MRALTVRPQQADSVEVVELPDPVPAEGELLVEGVALGMCGTDREIIAGRYGWPPPGKDRLVLGHESLGRVRHAPEGSGFATGDLVAGVVRRPDPTPCGACARGEFDTCRNGRYTERGIKEVDGYGAELWTVEVEYAVPLDSRLQQVGVLLEPTSVVAKAWEQIDRVGGRSWFEPRQALVTGAGPIGLLAALLGVQRGLEVHVLDRVSTGPKPDAVRELGAIYHDDSVPAVVKKLQPDVVIEATGAAVVVHDVIPHIGAYGIVCLTGVSPGGHSLDIDVGRINRGIVLNNTVVMGSVSANLRHYRAAAQALTEVDVNWAERLLTRRVPLAQFSKAALQKQPDDIKVVLALGE